MPSNPLRTAVLDAALPLIARESFTRCTVQDGARHAMRARRRGAQLDDAGSALGPALSNPVHADDGARGAQGTDGPEGPSDHIPSLELDSLLSTLFGSGTSPEAALVAHWADRGVEDMSAGTGRRVEETLSRRLEWSERTAGEHVVEVRSGVCCPRDAC